MNKQPKHKIVRHIKTKSGRIFKFEVEIDPNLKISKSEPSGGKSE